MEFGTGGLEISSQAFKDGGAIPSRYTCDGANVSPPISWAAGPDGTKSYALVVDDPDAPRGTFTHWVMFNIPADVHALPENVPASRTLANRARQGSNDFRKVGYGGPCPPSGTHRYFFRVYALSTDLDLEAGATKEQLVRAMEGRILAHGQLVGTYSRQR